MAIESVVSADYQLDLYGVVVRVLSLKMKVVGSKLI
jgi:hypothetical protein